MLNARDSLCLFYLQPHVAVSRYVMDVFFISCSLHFYSFVILLHCIVCLAVRLSVYVYLSVFQNIKCDIDTEGLLKVTGNHVRYECGTMIILETLYMVMLSLGTTTKN